MKKQKNLNGLGTKVLIILLILGLNSGVVMSENLPDLIVTDIEPNPPNPSIGDEVTFTVTTENQGNGNANGFYVYYYVDGSHKDSSWVSSLPSGESLTETFTWNAQDGDHSIKSVVDYGNRVTENNEENNEKTITFSGTLLSDLIVSNITWDPPTPSIGDLVKFKVLIKNQGVGDATNSFYVKYYIDGTYKGYDQISSMDKGINKTEEFTWNAESGSHTIKAIVDSDNQIPESNEGNNEKFVTFSSTSLSDLIVVSITPAPPNPSIGDLVKFKVLIKNQGVGDATNSFYVKYYVDESHISSGTIPSLDAGISTPQEFTWNAQAGTHSIRAAVDSSSQISESNEDNNEKVITFSGTKCDGIECGWNCYDYDAEGKCCNTTWHSGSNKCCKDSHCSSDYYCKDNNCIKRPYCGDSVVNDGEECDPPEYTEPCYFKKLSGERTCTEECKWGDCIVCGDSDCDGDETISSCPEDCDTCHDISCPDKCEGKVRHYDGVCKIGACDYKVEACSYKCEDLKCVINPNDMDGDGIKVEKDCNDDDPKNTRIRGMDSDNDGVSDCDDRCISTPGDLAKDGCPCKITEFCDDCLDFDNGEYCDCNGECASNYCLSKDKKCINKPTPLSFPSKTMRASQNNPGTLVVQVTNIINNPDVIGQISLDIPDDVQVTDVIGGSSGKAAYTVDYTVPAGGSRYIEIHFNSKKAGDYHVSATLYWHWKGDDPKRQQQIGIDHTVSIWPVCGENYCSPNNYCGQDGSCHEKKQNDVSCSNDYECMSGLCEKGKCANPSKSMFSNIRWELVGIYLVVFLILLILLLIIIILMKRKRRNERLRRRNERLI